MTAEPLPRTAAPIWLPPDAPAEESIQIRPAGKWWDAIRVPVHLGRPALAALGDTTGAVICDPRESAYYWLVQTGTAITWDVPGTRPCGETQYVAVPSASHAQRPGLHWLVPPTGCRCLTDGSRLRDALLAAVDAQFGPKRTAP